MRALLHDGWPGVSLFFIGAHIHWLCTEPGHGLTHWSDVIGILFWLFCFVKDWRPVRSVR